MSSTRIPEGTPNVPPQIPPQGDVSQKEKPASAEFSGRTFTKNFSPMERAGHIAWGLFLVIGSCGASLLAPTTRRYVLQQFAKSPIEKNSLTTLIEPAAEKKSIQELTTLLPLRSYSKEEITNFFRELRVSLGEARYNRICSRLEKEFGTMQLTKDCLKTFLLLMFNIQQDDISDLEGDPVEAYKTLIPFKSFDEFKKIFFWSSPKLEDFYVDKVKTSGKGLQGLEERVFLNTLHHFQVLGETDKERAFLRDGDMLSARFIDRENPKGTIIHLKTGVFYVAETFCSSGAYVAVLKDVSGKEAPKIICRGTAPRRTATSGYSSCVNDLLPEIGMLGVGAVWPALSNYLKEENVKSVEIVGKSLGGAIAQELAILTEGIAHIHVDRLITVCSVGIGHASNTLFIKNILKDRTEEDPFIIDVLRNRGDDAKGELDYAPIVGGEHMGAGATSDKCKSTVYGLYSPSAKSTQTPFAEGKIFVFYAQKLFKSLGACHCRQTTLKPDFKYSSTTSSPEANQMLLAGEILERIRRGVAFVFKNLTLHRFTYKSLESYFSHTTDEGGGGM